MARDDSAGVEELNPQKSFCHVNGSRRKGSVQSPKGRRKRQAICRRRGEGNKILDEGEEVRPPPRALGPDTRSATLSRALLLEEPWERPGHLRGSLKAWASNYSVSMESSREKGVHYH